MLKKHKSSNREKKKLNIQQRLNPLPLFSIFFWIYSCFFSLCYKITKMQKRMDRQMLPIKRIFCFFISLPPTSKKGVYPSEPYISIAIPSTEKCEITFKSLGGSIRMKLIEKYPDHVRYLLSNPKVKLVIDIETK